MAARGAPEYRWHDIGIVRATTFPDRLGMPPDMDLSGPGGADHGMEWIEERWRNADVRCAVGNASPDLADRVERLLAAPESASLRDVRRMVVSLASYLLRWRGRPTPFGRFAGVAPLRIAAPGADAAATVRWGHTHDVTVGVDGAWLGDVLARLHRCPALLDRLHVVVNQCLHERGDRVAVPGPPGDGPDRALAPIEVSVRNTRPVAAALAAAHDPVPYREVRERLAARFPGATDAQLDTVLRGLVEANVLLTSLSPPMTETDPLYYVCLELRSVRAHEVPDVRGDVDELYELHERITRAPDHTSDRRLIVDTTLDCEVRIPARVAQAARDAAVALYRLSSHPHGYPQWRDYHARFRARYGVGATVPVLDLVADSGLGLPADYLGAGRGRAPRQLSVRDEQFMELVQRALMDGTGEIVLTDTMIDALAGQPAADVQVPPRTEISVVVLADSTDALDRGDFRLMVTGTPRPGSSMAGRMSNLLPADDRIRLAATYAGHDGVAAQLVFPPRRRRNGNVTRTPRLLPHTISLGDFHRPDTHRIHVRDLAVTADAHRFHLVRLGNGEPIEPRVLHALEAGVHTPPLARFLAELCTARAAVYQGVHFGAAHRLPYLPRVRYRNTILAPARWLVTTDTIRPEGVSAARFDTDDHAWAAAFDSWRSRMRVPDRVAVVDIDQRLPLDLDRRLDRLVLRDRLTRAGRIELRETPAEHEVGWIGRAHELLIPLTLAPRPSPGCRPVVRAVTAADGHLPGDSRVLCARICGHPGRQDEILIAHLPMLVSRHLADVPSPELSWWFDRHRDMARPDADQYLCVRIHVNDSTGYGFVAERLGAWAADLRRARLLSSLTLATHEPQTGRYGHGAALDAAYELFSADSAAALAQIRCAAQGAHPAQAIAAASIVDLATAVIGSLPDACDWLVRELPRHTGPLDAALRNAVLTLVPGTVDTAVQQAWNVRTVAAARYGEALAAQARDPRTVLRSLLHHHHVRALGVDPDHERVTERLARALALRITADRRSRTGCSR